MNNLAFLYELSVKGNRVYLTDWDEIIEVDSVNFVPSQIKHENIKLSLIENNVFKITIPKAFYNSLSYKNNDDLSVRISTYDVETKIKKYLFSGNLLSEVSEDKNLVDLEVSTFDKNMRENIVRSRYFNKCQNLFGDSNCKMATTALQVSGKIITARKIEVTCTGTLNIDKLDLNMFRKFKLNGVDYYGSEVEISNVTYSSNNRVVFSSTVTLSSLLDESLIEGGTVEGYVTNTCDKSLVMCRQYNNERNFGGFPAIPVTNIVNTTFM